jgi:threonine/homoserine/homoserine lactone efflux protein
MRANYLGFLLAALLISMVPGSSTAVMLRETMRGGRRSGLAVIAGDKMGLLIWGVAAALGLSALLVTSPTVYDIIRILGAVVLGLLGIQALRTRLHQAETEAEVDTATAERAGISTGAPQSFRNGLVTSLGNVKGAVFALSFLPQFVPGGRSATVGLLILAALWAVVDGTWSLFLLLVMTRMKPVLSRPRVRQRMEQASGLVLILLGIRLAIESI